MAGFDIFDEIERLRRTGAPFCVATVLRTADATSAKAGAKATVSREGDIGGHLGGMCVQRAVQSAAATALKQGEPVMIRVKPSDKVVEMWDPDGVQTFKSGCPSGGTVDLLIEPFRLPPRLAVFGDGPIAHALMAHADLAGFRPLDAAQGLDGFEARDFVVVASQGNNDRAALRQALGSDAGHVSMVASRRKAQVLTARLAEEGMAPERLARLKSPAGLDIGAVDPHEIALSILAEIIQWRASQRQNDTGGQDEKLA